MRGLGNQAPLFCVRSCADPIAGSTAPSTVIVGVAAGAAALGIADVTLASALADPARSSSNASPLHAVEYADASLRGREGDNLSLFGTGGRDNYDFGSLAAAGDSRIPSNGRKISLDSKGNDDTVVFGNGAVSGSGSATGGTGGSTTIDAGDGDDYVDVGSNAASSFVNGGSNGSGGGRVCDESRWLTGNH